MVPLLPGSCTPWQKLLVLACYASYALITRTRRHVQVGKDETKGLYQQCILGIKKLKFAPSGSLQFGS